VGRERGGDQEQEGREREGGREKRGICIGREGYYSLLIGRRQRERERGRKEVISPLVSLESRASAL
jgi:hypothetical protein